MKPRAALASAVALLLLGCGDRSERPAPPSDPGAVLSRFVAAAHRRDAGAMWALLSRRTQRRYGPTLPGFTVAEVHVPESLTRPKVVLAERLTSTWAVAAVAGGGSPYAAALRFADGRWKLELGDPVRLRVLRPDAGERVDTTTQLAAEARARGPIDQAGLWLDGLAVPARAGGTSPRALSMYTGPSRFGRGAHVAVVFAAAGQDAAARAWRFSVAR